MSFIPHELWMAWGVFWSAMFAFYGCGCVSILSVPSVDDRSAKWAVLAVVSFFSSVTIGTLTWIYW